MTVIIKINQSKIGDVGSVVWDALKGIKVDVTITDLSEFIRLIKLKNVTAAALPWGKLQNIDEACDILIGYTRQKFDVVEIPQDILESHFRSDDIHIMKFRKKCISDR
ncbi:hypothetical protein ACJMK2_002727 [Sinanodonta woodiana]|uniref:Uncharacterized protein n=1 Tax=Sinanodonta woodiana TaxID=1069815 RepID=A0ABD3XXX4_SINWO